MNAMAMKEMAEEYRKNAETLAEKIAELNAELQKGGLGCEERRSLKAKIARVDKMRREAESVASYMENYYDPKCKQDKRYTP